MRNGEHAGQSSGSEDVGWTTSWLCEHVYGGKSSKSQRGALMRAIKTMKLPLGWKFERGWDELQLINERGSTLADGRTTRKVMGELVVAGVEQRRCFLPGSCARQSFCHSNSNSCRDFRSWHKTDIDFDAEHVRFRGGKADIPDPLSNVR
jgi:hypothetical protein